MTVDIPTAGIIAGGAGALLGATAWVLRRIVFDPIEQLRQANVRQGRRLGRLRSWQVAHDAVERAAGRQPIGDWSEEDADE